jgi:hypothetical protein
MTQAKESPTERLWNADYIKVMTTNFLLYFLTSSLKKHTFYNLLINNILYLCVT